MLGQAFASQLGPRHCAALTHAQCDITNTSTLSDIMSHYHPKAVINCAAIADVDRCEKDPLPCEAVNATAVAHLAELCQRHTCTLIHFSTDYVFDGSGDAPFAEDHPRHPINVYGRSKAGSEMAIQSAGSEFIIARVQWIFGPGRRNFIVDTAKSLKEGRPVKAFEDQWGAPGFSRDTAHAVLRLYEGGHRGIFHVTSQPHVSRVMIAEEIARQMGVLTPQITPVRMQNLQLPATRPRNCRLSIDKLRQLGIDMPPWPDAIHRYLIEEGFIPHD